MLTAQQPPIINGRLVVQPASSPFAESFRHLVVRQFVHDAEFESVALVLRQLIERGSKRGAWREPFFDGGISVLGSEVERESETQARTRLDAVVADRLAENVPGNSEQPRKS